MGSAEKGISAERENTMKLIAHGCGPTVHPSHTISSARLALQQGADLIELDVQFTSDRRLAVFHDRSLKSRFGVEAECGDLAAEAFLALRMRRDPLYPGYLLEHFFQCGVAPILIHYYKNVHTAVLDLVEEYGYADRVVLGVNDAALVQDAKKRFAETDVLGFIPDPSEIEAFAAAGASYIRLWERWLTGENVHRVQASGAKLWVMSGGPETGCPVGKPSVDGLWRIAQWEPDGILVDNVPFARAVLEEG
jgi:hypothetical protein